MAAAKLRVSRRRPETGALNPHLHTVALDGVFAEDDAGELTFHPLRCLTNDDVADVLQIASARIIALLRQWLCEPVQAAPFDAP